MEKQQVDIEYDPEALKEMSSSGLDSLPWDQRNTLRPPPYQGPLKRLLAGINIGDPRVDALPASAVSCHGMEPRKIGMDPHPEWVDWEKVRRGQKVFLEYVGPTYFALTLALLQGFSIARFAEVLYANGYAQSSETAFERYRETSFAIIDWMSHPLDVPDSKSQLQIQNVRAMHSFARRRSKKMFDQANGEGVALSQYDMAEVQLAFAGIAFNVLKHEFGMQIPTELMDDWCHVWRLVGYHLGIMDEYNCCNSLDDLNAMVDEYLTFVPLRYKTCRAATFELQRTALEGFGKYTGIGIDFFSGVLHASCEARDWGGADLDYLERPCLPGMKLFGLKFLNSLSNPWLSDPLRIGMNRSVVNLRLEYGSNPDRAKRVLPILSAVSKLNDMFLWRVVGWTALQLTSWWKRVILGFVLGLLSMRGMYKATVFINNLRRRVLNMA